MTRRRLLPGHWDAYGHATPDHLCSDLDAVLPPSTAALLQGHEPVYQSPPPARRGRGLAVAILAVALIAAGALLVLAPISATTAVATWVGPR
jgi:hypothetical protein